MLQTSGAPVNVSSPPVTFFGENGRGCFRGWPPAPPGTPRAMTTSKAVANALTITRQGSAPVTVFANDVPAFGRLAAFEWFRRGMLPGSPVSGAR